MSIYAIGDLHLPGGIDKSMERFGWINHKEKIFDGWNSKVEQEDLVLLAGDISWAMSMDNAQADLMEISTMPGKKVMIRGNHDYWWNSLTKMSKAFPEIFFLQNNCYHYQDVVICGSRGWLCPNDRYFTAEDEKIYKRELHRLTLSLEAGKKSGAEQIIVMIHYPPTNDKMESSGFTDLFQKYEVEKVVYGHLHGPDSFKAGLKGRHEGIEYFLVSCDYTDFELKKI